VVTSNPAISITKSPDDQVVPSGSTVRWTIVVRNTGNVTLTNVRVTDPLAPNCNRTSTQIPALASMAPGASVTYTCNRANVTVGFTNVANVVGTPPSGPNVTDSDDARVRVQVLRPATAPAIQITKNPKSQTVPMGDPARWTIVVTNTGEERLTNVRVTDPKAPNCNRTFPGALAPGASRTYTCARPNTRENYRNIAAVVGTAPDGERVRDTDFADVKTSVMKPAPKPKPKPKPPTVSHVTPKATG
jgi:uncharacterized repeat protein (TIGR01451 family)